MNQQEIKAVLATAMSFDNRKMPGDSQVAAWTDAANIGRWTVNEAVEAVKLHYATATDFVMPGHVTAIIKQARRQPAPIDEDRQLDAAPPADPERVRAIVGELSNRLGWVTEPDGQEHVREVECPWCHAAPKRPCARAIPSGRRQGEMVPISHYHDSRIQTADALREENH